MTEPASIRAGSPAVKLGGKEWPVPELAIRQLRACRRQIIDLTEAINPVIEKSEDGSAKVVASAGERFIKLTADEFASMCDVVYHGLTRAHPSLTPREFEELAATDAEIFLAFLVVRRQSGIFVEIPPHETEKTSKGEDIPANLSADAAAKAEAGVAKEQARTSRIGTV